MTVDADGTSTPLMMSMPSQGTIASLTSRKAQASSIFELAKPKFGDVCDISHDLWSAWTGDKPKSNWSGLEDPTPKTVTPNQCRMSSVSGRAKALACHVWELCAKFTRDSDLCTFQTKFMRHLVQCRLDAITCIQDLTKSIDALFVVTDHTLFNIKKVVAMGNDLMKHFDKCNHENICDAKEFLFNSINNELETQLHQNCKNNGSFVLWPSGST